MLPNEALISKSTNKQTKYYYVEKHAHLLNNAIASRLKLFFQSVKKKLNQQKSTIKRRLTNSEKTRK
jgi:hypothetical protein